MTWKRYVREYRGDLKAASRAYRSAKRNAPVLLNDVSLLSRTSVARLLYPASVKEVQDAVRGAAHVCVRGTAHSMGGHTLLTGATCLDMGAMNNILVRTRDVIVGAGVTWKDLLLALDAKGRTVMCMQSYADFSVGGSVAVNAHGPSNDVLVHSVDAFDMVLADGRLAVCTRRQNSDLFANALGGYGLLGVICSVTLTTIPNTLLRQASFVQSLPLRSLLAWQNKQSSGTPPKKCMFTVRVDTTSRDQRKAFSHATAIAWQDTGVAATERLNAQHAGSMQEMLQTFFGEVQRATLSTSIGVWIAKKVMTKRGERSIDSGKDAAARISTNQMRYQLCKYVTPHQHSPHTFILFESFLPRNAHVVASFLTDVREKVVPNMHELANALDPVFLLSLYIRFVEPDTTTTLSYAHAPRVSFVFYFKVARDEESVARYDAACARLVATTLAHGGSFYLPYRACFDCDQLRSSYPNVDAFAACKRARDPTSKFMNAFGETVMACGTSDSSRAKLSHQPARAK